MSSCVVETYTIKDGIEYRVLVVRITSPSQILDCGQESIHEALHKEGLGKSVGLYF